MLTPPVLANRHPVRFRQAVRAWPYRQRVLIVGDSWMRYDSLFPLSLFGRSSNLAKEVLKLHPVVSLSMSSNGDTLSSMLSDEGLARIGNALRLEPFTYVFFSGGGNDIVNQLQALVFTYEPGMQHARHCVKSLYVESALRVMAERLTALVDLVASVSPGTRIVLHNYGTPNLRAGGFRRLGVTWAGPWILPKLKAMGYSLGWAHDIIQDIMWRYNRMLESVWPAIEIADTASLIQPHHWRDEMHLTPEGYAVAARAYLPILQRQDGTRGAGYR